MKHDFVSARSADVFSSSLAAEHAIHIAAVRSAFSGFDVRPDGVKSEAGLAPVPGQAVILGSENRFGVDVMAGLKITVGLSIYVSRVRPIAVVGSLGAICSNVASAAFVCGTPLLVAVKKCCPMSFLNFAHAMAVISAAALCAWF